MQNIWNALLEEVIVGTKTIDEAVSEIELAIADSLKEGKLYSLAELHNRLSSGGEYELENEKLLGELNA